MQIKVALLSLVLATPLAAQEDLPPVTEEAEDGLSLMEEGARLLFRGLMSEMEPALDEMGRALAEMEPALQELLAIIDDIRHYDTPRVLDNGDILIPRKPDAPPPRRLPPEHAQDPAQGEIEL